MENAWLAEEYYDGISETFKEYPAYIIAEIGSNWKNLTEPKNDLHSCLMSIEMAANCGADAVKFQIFTHHEMYGMAGDDTFALPTAWIPKLAKFAKKNKIDFMCSGFSVDSILLLDEYVSIHKIASSKVGDKQVLEYIKRNQKRFIVSDGMFDIPKLENVIPMVCASAYPAQPKDYNLYKMLAYSRAPYGYGLSDHTLGTGLAEIFRAHGCRYFEKHVNFLGRSKTPDACVSIDTNQFRLYVKAIRETEVGRPRNVTKQARKLWGDRFDSKVGRYVRPKR